MVRTLLLALLFAGAYSQGAFAWDGTDSTTGASVEIEKGNLVREGEDIQVYDYGSGEYRDVTVQDIDRSGSSVDVEVIDSQSGETRTLELDDDE